MPIKPVQRGEYASPQHNTVQIRSPFTNVSYKYDLEKLRWWGDERCERETPTAPKTGEWELFTDFHFHCEWTTYFRFPIFKNTNFRNLIPVQTSAPLRESVRSKGPQDNNKPSFFMMKIWKIVISKFQEKVTIKSRFDRSETAHHKGPQRVFQVCLPFLPLLPHWLLVENVDEKCETPNCEFRNDFWKWTPAVKVPVGERQKTLLAHTPKVGIRAGKCAWETPTKIEVAQTVFWFFSLCEPFQFAKWALYRFISFWVL